MKSVIIGFLLIVALQFPIPGRAEVRVQSELIELSRGESITSAYAVLLRDETGTSPLADKSPELNTRSALVEKLGDNRYRIAVRFEDSDFSENTKYVVFATLSSGRVVSSPTRILSLKDGFAVPAGVSCSKDSQRLSAQDVALLGSEQIARKIEEKRRAVADLENTIRKILDRKALTQLMQLEAKYGVVVSDRWSKGLTTEQLLDRVARLDCVAD